MKKPGKARMIWGIILVVVGVIGVLGVPEVNYGAYVGTCFSVIIAGVLLCLFYLRARNKYIQNSNYEAAKRAEIQAANEERLNMAREQQAERLERIRKAQEAAEKRREQKENAMTECLHCGAVSRGDICEYCGCYKL